MWSGDAGDAAANTVDDGGSGGDDEDDTGMDVLMSLGMTWMPFVTPLLLPLLPLEFGDAGVDGGAEWQLLVLPVLLFRWLLMMVAGDVVLDTVTDGPMGVFLIEIELARTLAAGWLPVVVMMTSWPLIRPSVVAVGGESPFRSLNGDSEGPGGLSRLGS